MLRFKTLSSTFIFISIHILLTESNIFNIDRSFTLYFRNFKNKGNRGYSKGCCNATIGDACVPCSYKLTINFGPDFASFGRQIEEVVTFFNEPFEESNEQIFYRKLLPSKRLECEVYFTPKDSNTIVDIWPFELYDKYQDMFTDFYGNNYLMQITGYTNCKNLDSGFSDYFTLHHHLVVKISSLYWISYTDETEMCCNQAEVHPCSSYCPYYIIINNEDFNPFPRMASKTRLDKQNSLISIHSSRFDKAFLHLTIMITTQKYFKKRILDTFALSNFTYEPNKLYEFNNFMGTHRHIKSNFTLFHVCGNNYYKNCEKNCVPALGTNYCEEDMGFYDKNCTNGALDIITCSNVPLKCRPDLCKNRGKCQNAINNVICLCKPGYMGKFCEDYTCATSCHGRGLCSGPNKCTCWEPYFGAECEAVFCDDVSAKKCNHDGICVIRFGQERCECKNSQVEGKYCDEPVCNDSCNIGHCIYNHLKKRKQCVCLLGYSGQYCEKTKSVYYLVRLKHKILLLLALFLQVILLIAVMVFLTCVRRRKNLHRQPTPYLLKSSLFI